MKIKKVLLFNLFLISVISCTVDSEVENENLETLDKETVVTTIGSEAETEGKQESVQNEELLKEMQLLSDELYRVALEDKGEYDPDISKNTSRSFSAPPPYFSSNFGSVFLNVNGQSDTSNSLNFGNRAAEHTTQWISLTLTDFINVTDVGAGAQNNVITGRVTYDLSGINQRVFLNYRINPPGNNGLRTLRITPGSSANFLQHNIAPATIDASGPIKLTIHANEFGWLWLRIIQNGVEKFNAHYRFNYSTSNDNRNGGRVSISGFNAVGLPNIPYTVSSEQHSYTGYCGWFMAQ